MPRIELLISGRVQGVYYRATTCSVARGLGLTGFVRNLAGGQVEAVAEGPQQALDALVTWCHSGPPMARVDAVAATPAPETGEFAEFDVR